MLTFSWTFEGRKDFIFLKIKSRVMIYELRMKYLASSVMLLLGCNVNNRNTELITGTDSSSSSMPLPSREKAPQENKGNVNWQRLVMHQFLNSNGEVMAEMPLPADWQRSEGNTKGQPSFTGPHGLKVTDYSLRNFMYTNDPRMQQVYFQSGQQLRSMPGIEQLIAQDIVPQANSMDLHFVRYYQLEDVSRTEKWYSDQLYKAVPSQSEVGSIGTDWTTSSGDPYFLIVHLNVSTTAELQLWSYWCTTLEAEKEYFPLAKKQLLFGLANTHYPLEPIMTYNRSEAEKAGQSWAAFNQRMAQNQAAFEANQRAHVNRTNAINDATMQGWNDRNASSDRQQAQTIDGIYERTNVVDPSTGQRYKVSAGNNQYWMNNNGEYIGVNRPDYDPNLDENMNDLKWQQLNEVK
jgi:hypothetical protein